MNEMKIPAGYKQTEVGVIPEDWEIKRLGDVSSFRTGPFGSALHKSDYTYDGVPIINPMHIVDGRLIPSLAMSITEDTAKRLSDFRLSKNEIIIGRRGDMGRCAVVRENNIGWLCGTGSMIVRTNTSVNPDFIQRILASPEIIAAITETSVGSTMINLNQSTLSNLKIKCPPVEEQTAIASALSDMDALLDGLDRLITKKRNLKQAAMQQLLTGKTRLAGFEGEWEVKRLEEVVEIDPENLGCLANTDYAFNYIALENVERGTLVGYSEQIFASSPSRARRKIRQDDILIATVRPNLQSHLLFRCSEGEWVCSTGFCVVRCRTGVSNPEYVFQHCFANTINQQIDALITGSNYPAINSADVRALKIPMPHIEEQEAIAAVLSDMDAEIAALEQRRTKTRDIKQGMMQELLTGRTRLVAVNPAETQPVSTTG